MNTKEVKILYTATENLHRVTRVDAAIIQKDIRGDVYEYNAFVEFTFGSRKQTFLVEIKNELGRTIFPIFINKGKLQVKHFF